MYKSETRQRRQRLIENHGNEDSSEVVEKSWASSESLSESPKRQIVEVDKRSSVGDSSPIPEDDQEEMEDDNVEHEEEVEDVAEEHLTNIPEISTQELLNLPKQTPGEIWSLVIKKLPIKKTEEEWEQMKELIFVPSNNFQFEDEETTQREDDGLFIGSSIPLAPRNISRLKERIYRESGGESRWFVEGNLQSIANPYRPYHVELIIPIDESMRGIVVFRSPSRDDAHQLKHRQLDNQNMYEMTLEVGSIRFLHHPLFSKEHVLSEELKSLFTVYAKRLEVSQSERCEQRVRALRETLRHIKGSLADAEEIAVKSKLQRRLTKYRKELDELREERDETLRIDKLIFQKILNKWKQIKTLRNEQGFVNTNVQLKIISLEVDKHREKQNRDEDIELEFQDVKEIFQENCNSQMRIYRRKLRKWSKSRRVPAEKPYDGEENGGSTGSDSLPFSKPTPPSPFNEKNVRDEILKKFNDLKRLPGEPKVILEIETTPITLTKDLPSDALELRRRKVMESKKVQFRIWFNMKADYKSERKSVASDFVVHFNEIVKIPVSEIPECLHIEIREDGNTLPILEIGIPNSKTSFDRSLVQSLMFFGSAEEIVKTGNAGVGTGTKFRILKKEYEGVGLSGELSFRIGWSDAHGKLLCPSNTDGGERPHDEENPCPPRPLHPINTDKENQDFKIDPNDPANLELLLETSIDPQSEDLQNGSKLILHPDEFCDWSEIENSNRLRLLFLRDQGVTEFKNMKMIPASEAEVLPDMFYEYEKRLEAERAKEAGLDLKETKDEEEEENWDRLQPIREMRMRLLESFESSVKQITFEDLVIEEQIPDIGTLGLNIMSLFQARRPLRPIRKERKRIQMTLLGHTKRDIVVNIVRATNLPLRKDYSHLQMLSTEAITGVSVVKKGGAGTWVQGVVKPFVEVWFQRKVSRTTTALGPDPTWNQEIQLPLMVDNEDYSDSILSRLEDDIYLQVYDELAIDLLEDERRRETDIHQRFEKRWLGSISIPFVTLYRTGRIEGTFRLNSPPILLGYETKSSSEGIPESYLTLFVTLQPTISPAPIVHGPCSATGESSEMLGHVQAWNREIQKVGRNVEPFVLTPNGNTVLACRFLTPVEPPEELLHEDSTILEKMETLAHYVCLFPSLRDASLGVSQFALWFTPDVFINTPGGGREDHSVLLASFFLYLGVNTWIIQGESIPDGPTTHLLTSFKKSGDDTSKTPLLWNPSAGTYTKVNHTRTSLTKIMSTIGQFNIWANVSKKDRPDELDWIIEKSKDWLPLFPKEIPESKLSRVEMGPIAFTEADEREGSRLGQRIERHLKESFMKWRSSRTNWNRYSTTKLRSFLPLLEERRSQGSLGLVHDDAYLKELQDLMKSFEITGFPLHQPYSTIKSIMESVYSTGVHTIDTPHVQFALAAYTKAYPASIYSLWVYIAALHPIR